MVTGLHNEKEQRDGANVEVLRASIAHVQDTLEHPGTYSVGIFNSQSHFIQVPKTVSSSSSPLPSSPLSS